MLADLILVLPSFRLSASTTLRVTSYYGVYTRVFHTNTSAEIYLASQHFSLYGFLTHSLENGVYLDRQVF